MSDPVERRLLVPMNIEALVIGASPGTDWVNLVPDFRAVFANQFLGQQLEPPPGNTDSGLNQEPGVHLHWALPDGLTHGVASQNGQGADFPLIPNRWLVVRLWDQTEEKSELNLQFRAWIVESDTITDQDTGAIWLSLGAGNPNPQNERDYSVRVGRQFELGQWPGETAASSIDISAVGYGDPSFAAYYPASRRMLGFYDSDLDDLEDVGLTYFVAGWYAKHDKDPLHRALTEATKDEEPQAVGGISVAGCARLDAFLARAQWIYPGYAEAGAKVQRAREVDANLKEAREMAQRLAASSEAREALTALQTQITDLEKESDTLSGDISALQQDLPGRIVCHGVVSGIRWQKKDTLYDSGIPHGKPFSVAVGNTAVEALAALFQTQLDSGVAKLLEAFQYDLLAELETPGGEEKFEQKIHERRYRPLSRGIRWDLIQETAPTDAAPVESTPPIPGDIRVLLESINSLQRDINRLKRERDSRKSELYATWYRTVLGSGDGSLTQPQIDLLSRQMRDLQGAIDGLTSQIAAREDPTEGRPSGPQWDALQARLDTLLPGYELRPLEELRFWRPNDPVVLLAGQAFQRTFRHGDDGRYRSDGRLLCRLSGQQFDGMRVTVPQAKIPQVPFGQGDVDRWCNPLPETDGGPLPPGVRESLRSLIQEALLLTLDSKRAQQVVAAAYEKNEAGLAEAHQADISQLGTGLLRYLQQTMDDARSVAAGAQGQGADSGAQPAASGTFSFDGAWPSPIAMNAWQKNPWLPLFLQWQVTWRPSYSETAHALDAWTLNPAGTAFEEKAGSAGDEQVYAGTTLLTPGAALHLSDRLRQYNLTHDSPQLRALQTAVSRMAVLCQTFGGLTENLLMRKGCLELRPLDPGTDDRGPLPSPVLDWVQDVDWLSPLTDKAFFPVRAGHLTIGKLWVIDAFGQLLQLELEDAGKLNQPRVYERLAGSGGDISLEPRLAQPARLGIEWLPASRWKTDAPPSQDEEFDPVCGWIVPNLLDRGLMIYDARGCALGALQAVQRKSWDQGAGAKRDEIESFHWVDIPGSKNFFFGKPPTQISDPLGAGANPHLREYVRGLLALTGGSGAAFGQLLDEMDQALSTGGGRGASRNSGLALLIGRPLALVRATIRLELDGGAALAQAWDDVQKAAKDRTCGIEALEVPVRLGDRRLWNGMWLGDDGLAGFFLKQDYSRFYPAYGLRGRDDAYSKYGWAPAVSIDEPLDLTLLMDPSQGVCATTGILPRVIFNLPYGDLTEILESKQVVFFTGPLISTAGGVRMPQPSDLYGQWSWTHHPAVEVWREEEIIDTRKEEGRVFNDTLQIAEGWLKLVTAPLAIRTFQVKGVEPARKEQKPSKPDDPPIPAQFEVPSGTRILLSWVAIGADEIELKEGNISLVKSARHPLPVQCRVHVTQTTSFTLIATGRAEQPVGAHEARGNQQAQRKIEKTIEIIVVAKRP